MKIISLIFVLIPALTFAGPQEAFNQGTDFGKSEVGDVKGQISTTNASGSIPNYTNTNGASNYYLDGKGSLAAPASGDVTNCTSASSDTDPDAHTHGKCEGVRMLMSDPGKKNLMFPLNKNTDPLVLERNKVKANPDAYLGSLNTSGNYSACVEKTVTEPNVYTEEICNEAIGLETSKCKRGFSANIGVTIKSDTFDVNHGSSVGNYSAKTFNLNMPVEGNPEYFILNFYQIDNYGQVWVNGTKVYENVLPGYTDMRNGWVGMSCSSTGFWGGQQCSYNYYDKSGKNLGRFYDDGCNSGCRGINMSLNITQYIREGDNQITLVCSNANKIGPCRIKIIGTSKKIEMLGSLIDNQCAALEERAK